MIGSPRKIRTFKQQILSLLALPISVPGQDGAGRKIRTTRYRPHFIETATGLQPAVRNALRSRERSRTFNRLLLKQTALPIGVLGLKIGAPPRIRTANIRFLRPAPLPVGLAGHGSPGGNRTRDNGFADHRALQLPANGSENRIRTCTSFDPKSNVLPITPSRKNWRKAQELNLQVVFQTLRFSKPLDVANVEPSVAAGQGVEPCNAHHAHSFQDCLTLSTVGPAIKKKASTIFLVEAGCSLVLKLTRELSAYDFDRTRGSTVIRRDSLKRR